MTEKIIGYLLLASGILIIGFAAVYVVNVFTKKSEPVEFFSFSGISLDLANLAGEKLSPDQMEELKSQNVSTKAQLIEPEVLNQPLNIAAHLFFMGFIVNVGFKIGSLGVLLLRPVKVKLKAQESTPKETPTT